MFGIKYFIFFVGMNVVVGFKLVVVVFNVGGFGVIGGMGYILVMFKEQIEEFKSYFVDKNVFFGVDLLLFQVGGNVCKIK